MEKDSIQFYNWVHHMKYETLSEAFREQRHLCPFVRSNSMKKNRVGELLFLRIQHWGERSIALLQYLEAFPRSPFLGSNTSSSLPSSSYMSSDSTYSTRTKWRFLAHGDVKSIAEPSASAVFWILYFSNWRKVLTTTVQSHFFSQSIVDWSIFLSKPLPSWYKRETALYYFYRGLLSILVV